ncbi:hypothetical protein BDN67DRAFT_1014943, partial [Paxillus ammoniavirescens]
MPSIVVELQSGPRYFNAVGDNKFGPFDTHVVATYRDYVITSPNADFVPEPFVFEEALLQPLQDSRFGVYDCFQWPQLHCQIYKWASFIPRKETSHDTILKWCWWNLTQTDYMPEVRSVFEVSRMHLEKFQCLNTIYVDLQEHVKVWKTKQPRYMGSLKVDTWMGAVDLPLVFRDVVLLVANFQRLTLNVYGMLNYLEWSTSNPLRHATKELMGAFTTEPDVCQMLHEAHIPVWFIHPQSLLACEMNVHKVVSLVPPTNIFVNPDNLLNDGQNLPQGTNAGGTEVAEGSGGTGPSRTRRMDTITQGSSSAGPSRMRKTDTHARPYPPPTPGKGKKKTPAQNPVNSNADLWNKPNHEAIPPFIYNWNHTLSATNKDPKRVHPDTPKMAHHLPTPTLFMKVSSVERRTHYLTNWLTMRSAWITHLSVSDPTPIISHGWRDFLNDISEDSTSTSYSTKLKDEAIQLFGPDFLAIRHNELGPTVGFHDMVLPLKDLVNIDNVTFGKILWDLYEHNFCFELIALD